MKRSRRTAEEMCTNNKTRKKSQVHKHEEAENLSETIQFTLDAEQRQAMKLFDEAPVSIVTGDAGTGKTFLVCAYASLRLKQGIFKKIYISRSVFIEKSEQIGFTKGDIDEKMELYVYPLIQKFEKFLGASAVKLLKEREIIKVLPSGYFRGMTVDDGELLILDEAQNIESRAFEKTVTRVGKEGKIIMIGDIEQCDLKCFEDSGLYEMGFFNSPALAKIELTTNHRHDLVGDFVKFYKGVHKIKAEHKSHHIPKNVKI